MQTEQEPASSRRTMISIYPETRTLFNLVKAQIAADTEAIVTADDAIRFLSDLYLHTRSCHENAAAAKSAVQ